MKASLTLTDLPEGKVCMEIAFDPPVEPGEKKTAAIHTVLVLKKFAERMIFDQAPAPNSVPPPPEKNLIMLPFSNPAA